MNREIKFRAWDNEGEEMHKDVTPMYRNGELENIIFDYENAGYDFVDIEIKYCDAVLLYENNPYIIMQYTGLLDKNGVEIYEGDIVKGTAIQGEGGFDYFGEVEFITQNTAYGLQVTEPMRNGSAGGWSIDKLSTRISLDHITGEVIGNIHEHSHLLGGVEE